MQTTEQIRACLCIIQGRILIFLTLLELIQTHLMLLIILQMYSTQANMYSVSLGIPAVSTTHAPHMIKSMSCTCTWSLPPCPKSQTHCLPPHTPLFCLCAGPAPVLPRQWQNRVPLPWCRMSQHPACRSMPKI